MYVMITSVDDRVAMMYVDGFKVGYCCGSGREAATTTNSNIIFSTLFLSHVKHSFS